MRIKFMSEVANWFYGSSLFKVDNQLILSLSSIGFYN
jgi:hypothetical protein